MTTARARLTAVTLVLGAALVAIGIWISARRSPPSRMTDDEGNQASAIPIPTAVPESPPRLAAPPIESVVPRPPLPNAEAMPEGLAQDLEMFNTDQLRAELGSIALSYPAVTLVTAFCATRPCHAEVACQDVDQLNQFVEMVTSRFQGHVATQFEKRRSPDGRAVVHTSFTVGTKVRHTLARYTPTR